MLGPSVCENLCAPSKSGVSVSPSPVELLHSSPANLQGSVLWEFFHLMPDSQTVLEGYFMWKHACTARVGLILIFFGVRVVFSIDVCHLFPQCMLASIPSIGGVTDVVTRSCTGY